MKVLVQLLLLVSAASGFVVTTNTAVSTGVRTTSQLFERKAGTVKWFNTLKGFGFILPDDGSPDIFVHQTEIVADGFRSLADGEPVEYETLTDDNGRMKATKVTGPEGAQVQGAPFRPQEDRFDDFGGGY